MFKPKVPAYFCSIVLIIAAPAVANPRQPSTEPGKEQPFTTDSSRTTASKAKKNKVPLLIPGKRDANFVHAYLRGNREDLYYIRRRSEVPFEIIDSVFTRYHLPLELKYLAVIESDLKTTAVSRVGAKGPWQLMRGTAHNLGLKVNHAADERKNYYKSTRAAAIYLKDLHREFRDWLLVLAAYNGGPVPVYRAIRKAHSRDFWTLEKYLPAESRNHVKKFIATAYYFEGADSVNAFASLSHVQ